MNSQTRKLIIAGAVFGFLFVALGAFGAHGLKKSLTEEMMVVRNMSAFTASLVSALNEYVPVLRTATPNAAMPELSM